MMKRWSIKLKLTCLYGGFMILLIVAALAILFSGDSFPNADELRENLTCVMEIAPCEAEDYFDMDGLTERVDSPYGVY